jgi:hypothetical protein
MEYKQIAAVIQWTKDSISKTQGNPNEVLYRTFSRGTLGRIGRHESSMELILKYFWNHLE